MVTTSGRRGATTWSSHRDALRSASPVPQGPGCRWGRVRFDAMPSAAHAHMAPSIHHAPHGSHRETRVDDLMEASWTRLLPCETSGRSHGRWGATVTDAVRGRRPDRPSPPASARDADHSPATPPATAPRRAHDRLSASRVGGSAGPSDLGTGPRGPSSRRAHFRTNSRPRVRSLLCALRSSGWEPALRWRRTHRGAEGAPRPAGTLPP